MASLPLWPSDTSKRKPDVSVVPGDGGRMWVGAVVSPATVCRLDTTAPRGLESSAFARLLVMDRFRICAGTQRCHARVDADAASPKRQRIWLCRGKAAS